MNDYNRKMKKKPREGDRTPPGTIDKEWRV